MIRRIKYPVDCDSWMTRLDWEKLKKTSEVMNTGEKGRGIDTK
jgi:hypothetical protein